MLFRATVRPLFVFCLSAVDYLPFFVVVAAVFWWVYDTELGKHHADTSKACTEEDILRSPSPRTFITTPPPDILSHLSTVFHFSYFLVYRCTDTSVASRALILLLRVFVGTP